MVEKNMNKILTIIIPIYDDGKDLKTCLSTIFKDSEILSILEIFILNVSKSDFVSSFINNNYFQYKDIIKIVDEFDYYGKAMNFSIQNAKGKYITFLKCHDWINALALAHSIEKLKKYDADIIINPYIQFNGNDMNQKIVDKKLFLKYSSNYIYNFDKIKFLKPLSFCELTYNSLVLKNIKFDDDLFYLSSAYSLYPIRKVNSILFLNDSFYVYHINYDPQDLIMNVKITQDHVAQHCQSIRYCIHNFNKYKSLLSLNKLNYEKRYLNKIINIQYYVFLSFPPSTARMQQLMGWDAEIKEIVPEIYNMPSTVIISLIRKSKGKLYKMISFFVQKRLRHIRRMNRG